MCGAAHSTIKPADATRHFFLPAPATLFPFVSYRQEEINNHHPSVQLASFLLLSLPPTSTTQQNPPPATAVRPQSSQDRLRYGGNPEGNHFSESHKSIASTSRNPGRLIFDTAELGGLQTSPQSSKAPLRHHSHTKFSRSMPPPANFWKFDSGIKGTQPDRGLAY
jgi:hypothetical protein